MKHDSASRLPSSLRGDRATGPAPSWMGEGWGEETLFLDNDAFFAAKLSAMERARRSVDMEVYTFEPGRLADRLLESFRRAGARGVRVRLICDHWGSPDLDRGLFADLCRVGVKIHVYRSLPWSRLSLELGAKTSGPGAVLTRWLRRLVQINRGFHRKVTIIDGKEAWVSSMNVTDVHLREVHGKEAWKDIGVRLTGAAVTVFSHAFERAFFRRRKPRSLPLERRAPVLLNDSFLRRREMNRLMGRRFRQALARIWIQNPYFLPERRLLLELVRAARRGVDVRILIPQKNDLPLFRWINYGILCRLLRAGARVFECSGAFAHKKVLIVDALHSIGSTNLNHRSFLHDLEVEVFLTSDAAQNQLSAALCADEAASRELGLQELLQRPLWFRVLNRLLFFLRYWC